MATLQTHLHNLEQVGEALSEGSGLMHRSRAPLFDHFVGAILLEQNDKWAVSAPVT